MAYTENPRPIIRCQYWRTDEPVTCIYWDSETSICIYEVEKIVNGTAYTERGDLYPRCNYIGTGGGLCSKYDNGLEDDAEDADKQQSTCVLPSPYTHIARTPNCGKWITPTTTSGIADPLDFSPITEYNEGKCNYSKGDTSTGGTASTCTGHTPQHLGFTGKPIPESCTVSGTPEVITSVGQVQLPINFDILNKRAELGKCMWWNSYSTTHSYETISGTVNTSVVVAPDWACTNSSETIQAEYSVFYEDTTDKYIRPPCNGACPDCPKYTGNLASTGFLPFLSSVFLRHGDKIMAEQILELRYNIKKETWDPEQYKELFGGNTIIYAKETQLPRVITDSKGSIIDYQIDAMKVSIGDFRCLAFERIPIILTKGTPSDNEKTDFPTLIKQLWSLPLSPIIHSTFDTPWNINDLWLSFDQRTEYVYETPFTDHKSLLIVGEHFTVSDNYKNIIALNISDPEIDFPFMDLLHFKDMLEYKYAKGEEAFASFHENLECYLKVLDDIAPEKIYANTILTDNRAFICDVETVYGENTIIVFDVSRSIYYFDTIVVTKHYCGGVVAQTGHSVTSPDKEVGQDLVDYEFLNGHQIFNPTMSYSFKSFHSPDGGRTVPYMTYLDTKYLHLKSPTDFSDISHYTLGYRMYRVKILSNFFVDTCNTTTYSRIILLGNAGYMLVVIDDEYKLHNTIRSWDTGDLDENGNSQPMDLYLRGKDSKGDDHEIAMEVVEYCSNRLEINQLILKPKDQSKYVRLYGFNVFFGDIYVYERWSFGLTPDTEYTELRDGWGEDDIITRADTTLEGGMTDNHFTISSPPIAPIIATVVYRGGVTLRVKGQAKTDLMNWVKQPFCSDVEIMYSWTAAYKSYTLLPTHYCFVSAIGVSHTPPNTGEGPTYPLGGYTPYCGDHGFGRVSTRPAAMWYPYDACDNYASYGIYAGSGENDSAPMEFWLDENGKFEQGEEHNAQDLRMLGPAINSGVTTDVHTTVWACGCDWTHMNYEMTGTPWFSGWARIRSGVEGEAYELMTQNGGQEPKFGNKKRGYLLSYRSTAFLHYYELDSRGFPTVKSKWMPPYEGFSDLDLGRAYEDYPWAHYFNTSDNISTYMSQFGILGADSVDNVDISETLVRDGAENTPLKRYRFTEIFKAHHTLVGTRYPQPKKQYYVGKETPKPVTAWLTYKDYPDNPDLAIQWAWRENWNTLQRGKPDIRDTLRNLPLTECDNVDYNMTYLSFLGINYPNYAFDYRISEFRRVLAEGPHVLHWEPSIYVPETPLPTHFLLWVDDGPKRVLDPTCSLITNSDNIPAGLVFESTDLETLRLHTDFYDICSGPQWLNNVTSSMDIGGLGQIEDLMDILGTGNFMVYSSSTIVAATEEDAIENAVEDERVIQIPEDGEVVSYYFNRGLVLAIKFDKLQYLPRVEKLITIDYEFNLSVPSDDESQYSTITPLEYYPASETFGMVYSGLVGNEVTLIFKFSTELLLGKVEILYNFGQVVENEELNIKTFYNIPTASIKKSGDGQDYTGIASGSFEFPEDGTEPRVITETYDIDDADLNYMNDLYKFVSITFNYAPSVSEMENAGIEYSPDYTHLMDIRVIRLYTVEYTPLTEIIDTHERLYNISVGGFGDIPVHGHDNEGSLLYPIPTELSTIYQLDNNSGMIGASGTEGEFNSVSKIRGRKAKEIRIDPEVLSGDYPKFEGVQKKLYDEVALDGTDTITLSSFPRDIFAAALANTRADAYPQWACILDNKNMVPLRPVEQKSKYYPGGHYWIWGLDNVRDFYNCGGGGLRSWVTIFDYKWCRVSGIYGCTYDTDAVFDLYSFAVSKALTHWANNSGLDDFI